MSVLDVIRKPEKVELIKNRCGDNVEADGLECPFCGCLETYMDGNNPNDTTKWAFMIRAFKVDMWSHCTNCDNWFE